MRCEFYLPGCKALFRRYAAQEQQLRTAIEQHIDGQIATDFVHTKLASRRLFNGLKVYECRVNVGKLPALRVAFTVRTGVATVVYISTNIQKSEFSKEIDAFLK
ncbi:MAG: hypothetical protein PUK59_01125 [Actinomycetaceae bacterium]|nr:hypothetical protein [Actinomycetaceae bacterium]MDY5853990.1 hypothetical protein [Arcanobacterium sp.]